MTTTINNSEGGEDSDSGIAAGIVVTIIVAGLLSTFLLPVINDDMSKSKNDSASLEVNLSKPKNSSE